MIWGVSRYYAYFNIILGVFILIGVSSSINKKLEMVNEKKVSIDVKDQPISLLVGEDMVSEPKGTIIQSWDGENLNIKVVESTQSCGGIEWAPGYTVEGETIHLSALGVGHAMNCPSINVEFNFSIKSLPKKDYKITPTIQWFEPIE